MSIIDTIISYKFIQILSTPWKSMEAYKQGIIDEKGNLLIPRSKLTTPKQKSAYPSVFYTLCWNIKRILERVGLGQNIGGLIAALYLLKEKIKEVKESQEAWTKIQIEMVRLMEERGLSDSLNQLKESKETVLYPGKYIVNYQIVEVTEPTLPHGYCIGVPVFKVGKTFVNLFEAKRVDENGAGAVGGGSAPTNSVGGGAIAGVSPGQEPPGPKGGHKALKKRKKRMEKDIETINIVGPLNRGQS